MKFINPQFLWAFGVLAIPIIIHLFNFRRFKKVMFPNLRFLQEVQIQNKNKQQLKKLLVLASRLLALSFLVLAFAGPYIPGKDEGASAAGNVLSIYIDNSFSMNAEGSEGELLEVAKNRARNLAAAYNETDQFQLLSNDFEAKHQRLVDREAFLQWVDELGYSPKTRNLSEVYNRQKSVLQKEGGEQFKRLAFVISDFQQSVSDVENLQSDSTISVFFLPVEAQTRSNVSLDSVWFETPYVRSGEPALLHVRVMNYGSELLENATMTLEVNGVQKGLAALQVKGGLSAIIDLSFIPDKLGWNQAVLRIEDYPIVFDDALFFSFEVRDSRKVLHILADANPGKEVKSVYETDPYFQYQQMSVNSLDYRSFAEYDLILVDALAELSSGLASELKKYTEEAGSLIYIPNAENPESGNGLAGALELPLLGPKNASPQEIRFVNVQHPIYQEIISKMDERMPYPQLQAYYPWITTPAGAYERLLGTASDANILSLFERGKGQVYYFSIPLSVEWSSLTRHFLFPATLLQAGFRSIPGESLYKQIGGDMMMPLRLKANSNEEILELQGEKETSIPEILIRNNTQYLKMDETVQQAGSFWLRKKGETQNLQSLSVNYSRKESATASYTSDELKDRLPPGSSISIIDAKSVSVGKLVREIDAGEQLWKLAILLTLCFVAIEILLLRLLKTA